MPDEIVIVDSPNMDALEQAARILGPWMVTPLRRTLRARISLMTWARHRASLRPLGFHQIWPDNEMGEVYEGWQKTGKMRIIDPI
jgi:hypothetical protein